MRWSFAATLSTSIVAFLASIGLTGYALSGVTFSGMSSNSSPYVAEPVPTQTPPPSAPTTSSEAERPPESSAALAATGQFPVEDPGVNDSSGTRRSYPADGDKFAFDLETVDIFGTKFWVPSGWVREDLPLDEGYKCVRFNGPDHSAYVRFDVAPSFSESWPIDNFNKLEENFQKSNMYSYERVRLRTGAEAYYGGVIWNYLLKRKDGLKMKRTAVYFNYQNQNWAVGTAFEEDAPSGYGRLSTAIFDGLYTLP